MKCRAETGKNHCWSFTFIENGLIRSGGNGGGICCEAVIGAARTEPMGSLD